MLWNSDQTAAQMQSRTSDLMNTEVSAIMDAITDGKYNRLWVDENLHVQLMSNGKKISMDQVSRGTLEQIYFAIRMAATKILHEEECPVILMMHSAIMITGDLRRPFAG